MSFHSNELNLDSDRRHLDCVNPSHLCNPMRNHDYWHSIRKTTHEIGSFFADALWERSHISIQQTHRQRLSNAGFVRFPQRVMDDVKQAQRRNYQRMMGRCPMSAFGILLFLAADVKRMKVFLGNDGIA